MLLDALLDIVLEASLARFDFTCDDMTQAGEFRHRLFCSRFSIVPWRYLFLDQDARYRLQRQRCIVLSPDFLWRQNWAWAGLGDVGKQRACYEGHSIVLEEAISFYGTTEKWNEPLRISQCALEWHEVVRRHRCLL